MINHEAFFKLRCRRRTIQERQGIVEETLLPGASVLKVAARREREPGVLLAEAVSRGAGGRRHGSKPPAGEGLKQSDYGSRRITILFRDQEPGRCTQSTFSASVFRLSTNQPAILETQAEELPPSRKTPTISANCESVDCQESATSSFVPIRDNSWHPFSRSVPKPTAPTGQQP
jgi:hypothetical protein